MQVHGSNHRRRHHFVVGASLQVAGHLILVGVVMVLLLASTSQAQIGYTFTSGIAGDGFDWPPSPTGLLNFDYFATPDGVSFDNYTGNSVFFDEQYQVIGNAPGFSGEALWGNPLDNGYGSIDIWLSGAGPPQMVEFDFAWSVAGSPFATPQDVYVHVEDSDGRATDLYLYLNETFTGFGGFDGYADHLVFDAYNLTDDWFNVDGGTFVDIAYMYIYVDSIITGGPASEYGIDNFSLDGGLLMNGEVFPSVNGGTIDVTGSILTASALRGTGSYSTGAEITNGSSTDTTYSTQLEPGGDFSDNGQVNDATILAGQTVYTPEIMTISRSLISGSYESDVTVINTGNPADPDNTFTERVRLYEPPALTAPGPVEVNAAEKVQLSNAAAPTNGFRAAVKLTGTTVTDPFSVSGYEAGMAVKAGETAEGDPIFNRYGQLSDDYSGTMTASMEMTAFSSNDAFEVYLFFAEPVSDAQWTLEATLADILNDNAGYAAAEELGPGLVGVNSASTAGTILGGTATTTGNVTMALAAPSNGTSTGAIGDSVATDFSTGVPVHVVQLTYHPNDTCGAMTESQLRLLRFDSGASDWELAVNGNSDGGAGASFFAGSFVDFAATLNGDPLSSALGTHGIDTTGNHVWAIVDHESQFGVGEPGITCAIPPDFDGDGDVDQDDVDAFDACAGGPEMALTPGCGDRDFDGDNDVDQSDFGIVQRCLSGADIPFDPGCLD